VISFTLDPRDPGDWGILDFSHDVGPLFLLHLLNHFGMGEGYIFPLVVYAWR